MTEKEGMAQPQQHHMQSNGVIITPLHDELPASVPSGYPSADRSNGGANPAGTCVEGKGAHQVYFQPSYQQMQSSVPAAPPHMVAQGIAVGPLNSAAPLFCPREQDGPTFLGATVGHHPIAIHCGACGYQGPSHITQTRGWAHGMWALMTCGLGMLMPHVVCDTHHFCPNCGKHVGEAKLM